MTENTPRNDKARQGATTPSATAGDARAARLKSALKANLARRKAQERNRAARPVDTGMTPTPDNQDDPGAS